MSFTPNVPLVNQKINATTTLIQNNFIALDTELQNDHVNINDGVVANRLTHKHIRLNTGFGVPATDANQVAVYPAVVNGNVELLVRRASNGSSFALTSGGINPNLVVNGGYTFLPGGLVDMWGEITISNAILTLPNPGTAVISQIYNLQLTAKTITNNLFYGVSSIAGNQFTPFCKTANGGNSSITVYYRAVVAV